jgi:hypothetical protein
MALHSTAGILTQTEVTMQVGAGSRITVIDALHGMALALMVLPHAAFFIGVGMQAESYGGQRVYLQSPPYWISGLLTTLASPIFSAWRASAWRCSNSRGCAKAHHRGR